MRTPIRITTVVYPMSADFDHLPLYKSFLSTSINTLAHLHTHMSLQSECDTSGGRLISRFLEVQRLPAAVREASSKRRRGGCYNDLRRAANADEVGQSHS